MNLFGSQIELDLPLTSHSQSLLDCAVYSQVGTMPVGCGQLHLDSRLLHDDSVFQCPGLSPAGNAAVWRRHYTSFQAWEVEDQKAASQLGHYQSLYLHHSVSDEILSAALILLSSLGNSIRNQLHSLFSQSLPSKDFNKEPPKCH